MKKLVTSGEIQRLFATFDEGTIIRRPNLRRFARDNGVTLYMFETAWLIDFKEFMTAVTPKGEMPKAEIPIIRCKHSALILFNETHEYAVDKHTIDRCTDSPNVSKYKYERKWFINYKELEKEIERRIADGIEKKREKQVL